MAQLVKNLPAMQETWFRSLDQEDPLEKEMATHSNIRAWRIPWAEEPGWHGPWDHKELDMTVQLTLKDLFSSLSREQWQALFQGVKSTPPSQGEISERERTSHRPGHGHSLWCAFPFFFLSFRSF